MKNGKINILLDMDGVLSNFFRDALDRLNYFMREDVSEEEYVTKFGRYGMNEYFGISVKQFWEYVDIGDFWLELPPFPWASDLYNELSKYGMVTIVTTPSLRYDCARQKLEWLDKHLGVKSDEVFLGARKELMGGNGVLIDDYDKNCINFENNCGIAINVPSSWNKLDLCYGDVMSVIRPNLEAIMACEIQEAGCITNASNK